MIGLQECRLLGGRSADHGREAEPTRKIGDCDSDWTRPADDDLRTRQHRLDEDVHGAVTRAGVAGETHPLALFPGADAVLLQDVGRAIDRLSLMAHGIGGGTRIGDSLADFNRWHAARVVSSRTALVIVSDGYDTGDPDRLGREMERLRRRCRRIVWLNPLLGWRDYAPTARGMRAALPYIDLFAPAHNLESLAALEPYLTRM